MFGLDDGVNDTGEDGHHGLTRRAMEFGAEQGAGGTSCSATSATPPAEMFSTFALAANIVLVGHDLIDRFDRTRKVGPIRSSGGVGSGLARRRTPLRSALLNSAEKRNRVPIQRRLPTAREPRKPARKRSAPPSKTAVPRQQITLLKGMGDRQFHAARGDVPRCAPAQALTAPLAAGVSPSFGDEHCGGSARGGPSSAIGPAPEPPQAGFLRQAIPKRSGAVEHVTLHFTGYMVGIRRGCGPAQETIFKR